MATIEPLLNATAKARLFGMGSPATGEPAQLRISGDQMVVQSATAEHRAPIAALRVRRIGLDEAGLELGWDSAAGTRVVQVQGGDALRFLASQPELAAAPQFMALRGGRRRRSALRLLGWTAIAIFVLLPVLLLLLFVWQADRIAVAAASRLPIAQEVALGEQAFAGMRATLNLQESGSEQAAVRTLGRRLSQGSAYTYRFHVADSAVINAFALPGGIIVVNTGLIDATRRAEELAGVLAHEIQHVEQRHSLQAIVKELGLRGLWLLVTGDASGTLSAVALQLTSLKFSRDAEAQADAGGYQALVANGIDPRGMIDFFTLLAQQHSAEPPPFLSTHPASAQRQAALAAKQEALGGRHFEPLQFSSWPP